MYGEELIGLVTVNVQARMVRLENTVRLLISCYVF